MANTSKWSLKLFKGPDIYSSRNTNLSKCAQTALTSVKDTCHVSPVGKVRINTCLNALPRLLIQLWAHFYRFDFIRLANKFIQFKSQKTEIIHVLTQYFHVRIETKKAIDVCDWKSSFLLRKDTLMSTCTGSEWKERRTEIKCDRNRRDEKLIFPSSSPCITDNVTRSRGIYTIITEKTKDTLSLHFLRCYRRGWVTFIQPNDFDH